MIMSRNVKFALGFLLGSALGLTLGCATPPPERVDPRGQYPDAGLGNVGPHETGGVLVVSTSTTVDASSGRTLTNGPDVRSPVVHTGYTVFNSEGGFVQYVRNHSLAPSADEAPAEVALPPGRYLVRPDASEVARGPFWVTIEPEHDTRVDVARIGTTPPTPTPTPEVR
jgi:hypothetical protein